MLEYLEKNVNPKHRKTGDCSTRALVSVLGIGYDECLKEQMNASLKDYYDPTSKQTMEKVLKNHGWVKMKQPRKADGTKYTVRELDKIVSKNVRDKGVLVTISNHHTAVVGNNIVDIWDCGYKTICNYYIKP